MVDIGEKSCWNISAVSCGSVHKILILAHSAGFFSLSTIRICTSVTDSFYACVHLTFGH